MPVTPIAIPHFPFPRLGNVEYTDAQTDVVQNPVRVFFVQFVDDGLLRRHALRRGLDGDCVLEVTVTSCTLLRLRNADLDC